MEFPKHFFKNVFQNILQEHHFDIEIRCLHRSRDEDSLWPKQFWCRSLKKFENAWHEIAALNEQGYDVHYTVVPRLRESHGKREHPVAEKPIVSCLWADLDVGEGKPFKNLTDALKRVRKLKPYPNIVVKSGSGIHVYYLLKKPRKISKEHMERVLRTLAIRLNGDSGAARATRLMRVPGTYNWKNPKHKKLARPIYLSDEGHRLRELEKRWRQDEKNADSAASKGPSKSAKYRAFFEEHVNGLVVNGKGVEATGFCPFHDDQHPSFSANLETGLWLCHSSRCKGKGNLSQFCERLGVPLPKDAIQRFPRERKISEGDEWTNEYLFKQVYTYVTSQVHFAHRWQAVVVCVWAMGTYLYQQFPCYGHLWLNSPTTHSGKSKLLNVLWTICCKASAPQVEPTPAAIFRFPQSIGGCLLLDEVDNLDPEKRSAVIALLNSYYSCATVTRAMPGPHKKFVLEELPIYCPKVIAGINNLPSTLQDRCIKIFLHRKKTSEMVDRFMPDSYQSFETLRNQLDAWAIRDGMRIQTLYSHREELGVPSNADDRIKDLVEPLFAITSILPTWVREKMHEATKNLSEERNAEEAESNPVVLGLQILKEQFPEDKNIWRLRTEEAFSLFTKEIATIETKAQAQALLRKFGFRSKRTRIGTRVLRAYEIPMRGLKKLCRRYRLNSQAA